MANKILEGIRVIEFTVQWSGPYATRMMAEMGADVIRVEHPALLGGDAFDPRREYAQIRMAKATGMHLDPIAESPFQGVRRGLHNTWSANKRFITLDVTTPEGQEVLTELVKISDVCVENLTPNVVDKLGISYDRLKEANPEIIYCAMPGFGDGPWAHSVAYGDTMEHLSGVTSMTGYGGQDGNKPMRSGVYSVDPMAAMHCVAAVICALTHRKRTGRGVNIEVSQYEGGLNIVNEAIMDYTMNKRIRTPLGNNDREITFQGCYPAKGDDQWVVLSIRNKDEWAKLCGLLDKLDWLSDERYDEPSRLEAHRREIDDTIAAWTKRHTKEEITLFLQGINIPAAPVNSAEETLFDPQLRHRGLYKWIKYPYGVAGPIQGMPVNFTKTPLPEVYQPAKAVGSDNYYVYGHLLGMTESHIKELEEKKVIKR